MKPPPHFRSLAWPLNYNGKIFQNLWFIKQYFFYKTLMSKYQLDFLSQTQHLKKKMLNNNPKMQLLLT